MNKSAYDFQYCQKLVIFSKDKHEVLLAKRRGEADYDGVFSFVGGKMEVSDASIVEGMRREKNEELGSTVMLSLYPVSSNNSLFRKTDGSSMILPHYLAYYISGEIELNSDEYSEYRWVTIDNLNQLKPLIENIPNIVKWAMDIAENAQPADFVEI